MHTEAAGRDQVVEVEPEVQGEEEPVLDRAERDRRDRGLGDLAPDRRLLAGKDPQAQSAKLTRTRRTSAGSRRQRLAQTPATSWRAAVARDHEDEAERRGDRVAAEIAEGAGTAASLDAAVCLPRLAA